MRNYRPIRVGSVQLTSLPPEAALWRQSLRNQNLVGIVSLLCFEYLNTASPVLKISFTFQNTVAGWVRIWLISSVIVLVCVCVCASVNRTVCISIASWTTELLGNSFLFLFFINWHQTVLKLSSQQSPTSFTMSYMTLGLLPRGPCQIKIRPLG